MGMITKRKAIYMYLYFASFTTDKREKKEEEGRSVECCTAWLGDYVFARNRRRF